MVDGDRCVGGLVGERNVDAVAMAQGRSSVTAGGAVAGGGLLDHRWRGVDADHPVAVAEQDGCGAALPEADVENGARLGEAEHGERAIVGVGGRSFHGSAEETPEETSGESGLSRADAADDTGAGLDVGVHRGAPITRLRIIAAHASAVSAG